MTHQNPLGGYGADWSEPKATGLARLRQIAREPTAKTDLWVGLVAVALAAVVLCGVMG